MSVYPQLSSGAIVQFPFRSSHRRRTILNELPDGTTVRFEDWGSQQTFWRIDYADLSAAEWETLKALHDEMAGRLRTFIFFDPNANLAAWSEEFERSAWVKDPFLGVAEGATDPQGGTNARLLTNTSAIHQRVSQRLDIPEGYATAFSVWLRSDTPLAVSLVRQAESKEILVNTVWQRVQLCGRGSGGGEETEFGILIPGGSTVAAFGAQIEAQPSPSHYKRSESSSGIYAKTRFSSDKLQFWADGPGRYRAQVALESVLEAA